MFHRIKSDELWYFHLGSPLEIHLLSELNGYSSLSLGSSIEKRQNFQVAVPYGYWFGAEVTEPDSFSLVSCSVSPGFDFSDFEMGKKEELSSLFPSHRSIVERFCSS